MKKKIKKRHLTLIEMMIVIVLIGLIGGVIAYNVQGSLQEGKMCNTQLGGAQVYNILMLETLKGRTLENIRTEWATIVRHSPLAKNGEKLLRDGWGQEYQVTVRDDEILVESPRYTALYNARNGRPEGGPCYLR
jgi:general secretion pathway protein G